MDSTKEILLAPHNDDENLFASYTIQRIKPLVVVVTDGYIQGNRGDGITAEERREESRKAAKLLGYEVIFLGIKDTELTEELLEKELIKLQPHGWVYAPAIQGGNAQHDLVGRVADKLYGSTDPKGFGYVTHYTTYTRTELWTTGSKEIIPTQEEIDLKNKALDCYQSQINLGSTAPHFFAVRGRSEFYA